MNNRVNLPTEPAELDDLLGAYALDALERDERALVDAYFTTNPTAQREVDELRETAAMLALAPIDHEAAPPELWDRIANTVGSASVPPGAQVDELSAIRSRRRSVPLRIAAPLAAAAAALIAVLGVQANRHDYDQLALDFGDASRDGTVIDLEGTERASVALAGGRGVLRTVDLGRLDAGQVYQAWAVYEGGDAPISIAVFDATTDYTAFEYGPDLAAVAITVEDAPGVVTATRDPVAVGAVTRP